MHRPRPRLHDPRLGLPSRHRPTPRAPPPPPAGRQRRGTIAYFTSSEKLTDDANTGPEQPPPRIGRADLGAPDPDASKEEGFIPTKALGLAVDPSNTHVYWANPAKGTIGRANIDAHKADDEFIVPGETEAETHPGGQEEGVMISAPSTPRYVAVDAGHVYWTNTGPLGENVVGSGGEEPILGGGTIGRATLDSEGNVETVESDFINGATDPQGIAVDSSHLYWGNLGDHFAVARAPLGGGDFEPEFLRTKASRTPYGVALSGESIYLVEDEPANDNSLDSAGAAVRESKRNRRPRSCGRPRRCRHPQPRDRRLSRLLGPAGSKV